jgi:DNA-binding beta-propeller fold protein YncE
LLLASLGLAAGPAIAKSSHAAALRGPQVFGWGFNDPAAIASDGTHVWVINAGSSTVNELDAATGGLVQVLSAAKYRFNGPNAVSSDGTHVWVTNTDFGLSSVTEILAASSYRFTNPSAVSSDRTHV